MCTKEETLIRTVNDDYYSGKEIISVFQLPVLYMYSSCIYSDPH